VKQAVASLAMAELAPIDDVRASAEYRLVAAREIVGRALAFACPEQIERAA
jgi:CO/xanthine dehydrogenase FAD-binding subunit